MVNRNTEVEEENWFRETSGFANGGREYRLHGRGTVEESRNIKTLFMGRSRKRLLCRGVRALFLKGGLRRECS